ncbi:MAG: HAMP domain-containing histidine kinase [Acetatifactor sp.]|nr:HAMP domain-containing histidine kinase [Acetatifactor sp.]
MIFLRRLWRKWNEIRYQHPIPFLVVRYAIIGMIICVWITCAIGYQYYDDVREDYGRDFTMSVNQIVEKLRTKLLTETIKDANDQYFLHYVSQDMIAELTEYCKNKVYAFSTIYGKGIDSINSDEIDRAFLLLETIDTFNYREQKILSCPMSYLETVKKESIDAWENTHTRWDWSFKNDNGTWNITLEEGYYKECEFLPVKVKVCRGNSTDGHVYQCYTGDIPDGYKRIGYSNVNQIVFPEDTGKWINATAAEVNDLGDRWPVTGLCVPFRGSVFYGLQPINVFRAKILPDYVKIGNSALYDPFSFMKGNLAYEYNEYIYDVDGNTLRLNLGCVIPGELQNQIKYVIKKLMKTYVLTFLFLAFLGWLEYSTVYSLRAKNGFHKSLINSMAHDLKSPLMVMQGFGENLVENVHTEKKEYYAREILNNIHYLNELVDKNLDISRYEQKTLDGQEKLLLMDLVDESQKRYADLLEQKKLTIEKSKNMILYADKALMKIVIDNLIGNAVKYSPEGEIIQVIAEESRFIVDNKADLHYRKNVKHLLEPLEMGDKSRTAGTGHGLGLSIANSIIKEHGWRLEVKYNKKTQRFQCIVKIPSWPK